MMVVNVTFILLLISLKEWIAIPTRIKLEIKLTIAHHFYDSDTLKTLFQYTIKQRTITLL